jgi:hypothetical protein
MGKNGVAGDLGCDGIHIRYHESDQDGKKKKEKKCELPHFFDG